MPEQPLQVRLEATDHSPGQFTLTFNSSRYPVTLNPEANVSFSDWLRRLQPVLAGQHDPSGQLSSQELFRNVGTWLWQALLPDGAPAQERDALAQALRTGRTPLLLALPDTLAGLPWELLCDPELPAERDFLARRRPLMRFHPSDTSADMPVPPPLRVLLLISSPPGLGEDSRVDVESERAAVERATYTFREAGLLHLLIEDIVTPGRVQEVLVRFKPHILHYVGHGGFDEQTGGVLLWEDDQGNEFPLSDARLADILGPRNLQAVVLHACETGRSNARTDTRSMAGTLIHEGIPAVIAQQANFTYESSQHASKAWYTALTAGQGFAGALFEVRQALFQADRPDWAVPILQASAASLAPLLDDTASPGPPDPLLTSRGAAADLPAPTGEFVGRHRELRALCLLLEHVPGSGPVMALITGPGGVGKSTLASLAITRYGGKYKAALTLSCQGYQSIDLFLQRLGEFLKGLGTSGFLEQTLPDPELSTEAKIEQAVAALNSAGPVLLVVDNLESLQAEDQTLRDASLLHLLQKLLTNLRGGRVLITGRYAVKDLLPQGKFAAHLLRLDLDDLSPYETRQLLTRNSTLALLGETVRETLIREFGGLPYVYDLLSSPAARQSLDLLVHDAQNRITEERKQRSAELWHAVRRQVVEFAALDATISRLSAPSRALLVRLGVLRQSFPLAAIEQGLGAARAAWQPLLDWSLLRYDPLERTYRLHSITRRYAEDLLNEPDRIQAQAQLADWYEHYADRESHDLTDYLEAHRLWRAVGNLQQAGKLVMQLAEVLRRFGLYALLRELCTATLRDIRESGGRLAAPVLDELGKIAYLQGDYPEARRLYKQSLEIFEQLGNQDWRASTLQHLGMIAQDQEDYPEARRLYKQSLEIFERLDNQGGQAASLHQLGNIAYLQGDYPEARRLYGLSLEIFELLGNDSGRANSLGQLGNIAQDQGNYPEAQQLYKQSLEIFKQLGDHGGQAKTLHQLGMIAQDQEDYPEARRLYELSLEIEEQLGNDSGRASTLHQLGMVAYEQRDFEDALTYLLQAYILFDSLQSPSREVARHMIARIRGHIDEATFTARWRTVAGDRPMPLLSDEEINQQRMQVLIDFIQSPTWDESKRFLEAHLELLQPEVDLLLQQLAAQQEHDGARETVEEHRLLLAHCREKGIEVAFADRQRAQNPEMTFAADLNRIWAEVVNLLRTGEAEQREALATRLEQMLQADLPLAEALDFLQVLVAWLRGQDTRALEEKLQPPFRDGYAQMVADVEQEEMENTKKDDGLTDEELPRLVASVIVQGTEEQRRQFATTLLEAQQGLSPEEAALGRFFGCLAAALLGETPGVASLEALYTDLWQTFQDTLKAASGEESEGGV